MFSRCPWTEAFLGGKPNEIMALFNSLGNDSLRQTPLSPFCLALESPLPRDVLAILAERVPDLVDRTNLQGQRPLDLALATNGEMEVALLLGAGANPSLPNRQGLTPAMMAAWSGSMVLLDLVLLANGSLAGTCPDGKGVLYYGIDSLHPGIVERLLENGADVSEQPPKGSGYRDLPTVARAYQLENMAKSIEKAQEEKNYQRSLERYFVLSGNLPHSFDEAEHRL